MRERRRLQEPRLISEAPGVPHRRAELDRHTGEFRMPLEEGGDDALVLLGLTRAGRIGQSSAGTQADGGGGEHLSLRGGERREILHSTRPLQIGISTQHAQA